MQNLEILAGLPLIAIGVAISIHVRRRFTSRRLAFLSSRPEWSLNTLVQTIAMSEDGIDPRLVAQQLLKISAALSVPVGLLRAEDIVEDLAASDFYAGDRLLEIEKQLQILGNTSASKLTLKQIVVTLASGGLAEAS